MINPQFKFEGVTNKSSICFTLTFKMVYKLSHSLGITHSVTNLTLKVKVKVLPFKLIPSLDDQFALESKGQGRNIQNHLDDQ